MQNYGDAFSKSSSIVPLPGANIFLSGKTARCTNKVIADDTHPNKTTHVNSPMRSSSTGLVLSMRSSSTGPVLSNRNSLEIREQYVQQLLPR